MSITMDTTLASLVTNKRRVSALKSLGIVTVGDALTYYPFRVTEPVPLRAIREAAPGQQMAFAAVIRDMRVVPMNARRGYRLEATVDDADFARSRRVPGSTARLTFFSYRKSYVDWVSMRLRAGTPVVVSGMPSEYMGQLQFTHPEILTVAPGSAGAGAGLEGYARGAASGNGAFAGSTDPYASVQSAYPPAAAASSGAALKYDADTVQEALTRVCRPRPVYHASSRISSEHIHETILGLLWMMGARTSSTPDGKLAGAGSADIVAPTTDTIAVQNGEEKSGTTAESGAEALSQSVPDVLPESVRKAKNLMHRAEAFLAIHDPASTARFKEAIETLRYEEAFVSQTSLLKARQHAHKSSAHPCPLNEALETARASVGEAAAEPSAQPGASERGAATNLPDLPNLRDRFIASLPFTLTAGQSQVVDDIAADLERDWPMQRLLQGEVGSGKTVVALAAMLQAVGAGYQAVLVAPTQVLAEQHYETISKMVSGLALAQPGAKETDAAADVEGAMGASSASTVSSSKVSAEIPVTLLTGGMKLATRRKALAAAASGEPGIIVATHAAFSKTFQAPHLALVVIDEQHRFGVEQRESLNAKTDDGTTPHLLVMTATPIPRTAAMTWFGDLDISWLTELPGGRKPIRTVVVNEADAATMGRMFAHIRARVDAGERAYIVCPRIDADDEENEGGSGVSSAAGSARGRAAASGSSARTAAGGRATRAAADAIGIDDPYETFDENGETVARPPLHAVAEIADRLQRLPQFQGIRFATLTGRDKDDVKTQVMADFAGGETPILVSTTVIEVGVDVIFDADRYGLSQLHQLRGRVGRGGTNSWAFLISRAEPGSPAEQRLEVIHHSLDGTEIAQADLEFRGAGDVLGDAQSGGKSSLKLLRVVKDADMIADARTRAEQLLAADPELAGEVQLAGAVLDFTRGNETFLTSS